MFKYFKIYPIILVFLFSCSSVIAEEVLTWQDCIKEAAKNHPDLISAKEAVNQTEAAKSITKSGLFPQVNGNLSVAETKVNGVKPVKDYSYGATATQLIFDGLKTIDSVKAASENIKASQQAYRFTSGQVRLRLRTAFVALLRAQELIKVTDDIIKIRRGNYELITLRYQSGLEHKGALLTAEANLSEALFEMSQAKRDLELAQRQMTKEMGRKEFIPMSVKSDFTVIDSALTKPDFEILAKDNPSLQQVIDQENAAKFNLKSVYGNFYPTLSGNAGADKFDSRWPVKASEWNLGLAASVPLFEGGLRFAEVSQAKAQLNQLIASERSTKDGIVVGLEQAWVNLQDAIETVGVQTKQLAATEERAKIAEAQYSIGTLTYDNWTIIEDNLVSAKRAYLNAQSNALITEANWIQAKGEVLEYAQ